MILHIICILAFTIVIGVSIKQIFKDGFKRVWEDAKFIIIMYSYGFVLAFLTYGIIYLIRALIFGF